MYNTNYTLTIYNKMDKVCDIVVNTSGLTYTTYTDNPINLPFGVNKTPTLKDLDEYFEERCFPRERENCKQILQALDIPTYEPELICRKTHGLQFDDFLWLQFSDEPQVTYDEIKLRD